MKIFIKNNFTKLPYVLLSQKARNSFLFKQEVINIKIILHYSILSLCKKYPKLYRYKGAVILLLLILLNCHVQVFFGFLHN